MLERVGRLLVNWWPALMPFIVLGLVFYVWLCAWVYLNGAGLIFHPQPGPASPESVEQAGFRPVEIRTADGELLVAWWREPPPGAGVILFLHGDASTLAASVPRLLDLAAAGFGVLALEWRGYGGSTGVPNEKGLRLDARAGYDFVQAAAPGHRIAVFAESLGTGIAVELGLDRKVAGIVLHSPYASVVRFYEMRGPPFIPYRLLVRDPIDAEAMIARVDAPVLILQGTVDPVVPVTESRRLFAAAVEPKAMTEVPDAGHLQAWQGAARANALATLKAWTH